jgi:hypothetical protein
VALWLSSGVAHAEDSATNIPEATVSVRLDADDPRATLERHAGREAQPGVDPWQELCVAPCKTHVPADSALRVGGERLNPSRPFHLPEGRADVSAVAEVGTRAHTAWGYVLLLGGGGLALNGASFMVLGSIAPKERSTDGFGTAFTVAGGVMLGLGLAAAVGGIVLLSTDDTTVRISTREPRLALPGGLELRPNGIVF